MNEWPQLARGKSIADDRKWVVVGNVSKDRRIDCLAALLPNPPFRHRRDRLMSALDEINSRLGKWTAVTASQGFRREWKLRSEMRSPAWNTSIAEVPAMRA